MKPLRKERLDLILTERGLVESRSLAQRMIMAGQVRVDDQVVLKPAIKVDIKAQITIDKGPQYISRGGDKLASALLAFDLEELKDWVCVDVGASTGGFSDCLLQHGARRVYAVDVGYGVLHWKLRQDKRIIVMEKTNARYITGFDEKIDLVSIDTSFISLKVFIPVIKTWFEKNEGIIVALIKPQFEAGRKDAARGEGVIRDPAIHRKILHELLEYASQEGFGIQGLIRSPLIGPKGNVEFLTRLDYNKPTTIDIDGLIESVLVV